ncbi:hypothetical protein DKG71_01210 [Streptomyces sp. NEAU-S7GS2]|nr:hypothetical protein DKG71_01210 [Streptomyces sp. NEAU-S7GS2]
MNHAAPGDPSRPFTLIACTNCPNVAGEPGMDQLRAAVHTCPYGIMIATGCLGGLLRCTRSGGLHAAVQPCAKDRTPTGPVIRLGPIKTEADAELVGTWLRAGMPDDGTLPHGLRAEPAPRHVANLN